MKANGGIVSKAMLDAGYAPASATKLAVKKNKDWPTLLEKSMNDRKLLRVHDDLFKAGRLDKMEFPLGPRDEAERDMLNMQDERKADEDDRAYVPVDYLTDGDIRDMLAQSGCALRRIVRTRLFRHVYFASPDNRARKDALDMAYKIKGRYAPDRIIIPVMPTSDTEGMVMGVLGAFVHGRRGAIPVENQPVNDDIDQDHDE